MPSTRRPDRLRTLLLILGLAALLAACSNGSRHRSSAPTTTLVTADHWTVPAMAGPPSTSNFCSLVVSIYRHEATLPEAKDLKVREAIVADFVDLAPEIVSEAPPSIAPAARVYFGNMAAVMRILDRAGLDASKVKGGGPKVDLLSQQMTEASRTITSFSIAECHYTIGG